MKKRNSRNLSVRKTSISKLGTTQIIGGAPTTRQSQYCPDPIKVPTNFPLPQPLTQDTTVCTLWTYTE